MATPAPREDPTDADLSVGKAKTWAAGVPAVAHSLLMAQRQMGFWNPFFFEFKRLAYAAAS